MVCAIECLGSSAGLLLPLSRKTRSSVFMKLLQRVITAVREHFVLIELNKMFSSLVALRVRYKSTAKLSGGELARATDSIYAAVSLSTKVLVRELARDNSRGEEIRSKVKSIEEARTNLVKLFSQLSVSRCVERKCRRYLSFLEQRYPQDN